MTEEIKKILANKNVWTAEEEYMIFSYYKKHPTLELRNQIIVKNQGLVMKFANKFVNAGVDTDDLIQEGTFGLITAIEYFDCERGLKFSTYASNWIKQTMTRYVMNQRDTVRIPVHMLETKRQIEKIKKEYLKNHGTTPCASYMAEKLSISEEKINSVLALTQNLSTASLNSVVAPSGDEKKDTELIDLLEDTTIQNLEDEVVAHITLEKLLTCMKQVLTEKEYQIILMRFGIDGPAMTLEAVGQEFGVTRERIRQIEKKALRKLERNREIRKLR